MPLTAYTDGSCSPNPGPGGWGFVILNEREEVLLKECGYGGNVSASGRMELMAVVQAIKAVAGGVELVVLTDSEYVDKSLRERVKGWQARGWRLASGKPAKHVDLWTELLELTADGNIEVKWTRGHVGTRYNEMADRLANEGRQLSSS